MLKLKFWPWEDEQALQDLYAHTDQSYCLVQLPVPLPQIQTRNYLESVRIKNTDGKPFLCFAVLLDGECAGKIEVSRSEDDSAELDLVLRKEYTGQGHGTEALSTLISMVKRTHWCRSICAYVREDNLPMRRVLEKNEFEQARAFQADVLVPDHSGYSFRTIKGFEYIRNL